MNPRALFLGYSVLLGTLAGVAVVLVPLLEGPDAAPGVVFAAAVVLGLLVAGEWALLARDGLRGDW